VIVSVFRVTRVLQIPALIDLAQPDNPIGSILEADHSAVSERLELAFLQKALQFLDGGASSLSPASLTTSLKPPASTSERAV